MTRESQMLNEILAFFGNANDDSTVLVKQMAEVMKKRGQHGSIIKDEHAILGNALSDPSGKYSISFAGNQWGDGNPAQTVMELYKKHGLKSLTFIDGDFAFCLWDSKKRKLFAARDRFGIKPLYYINQSDLTVFASEINALLTASVPRVPNKNLIGDHLLHGTLRRRNGETFFEGVSELLPGHYIYCNPKLEQLIQKRYWFHSKPATKKGSEQDLVNEFSNLLTHTVRNMIPAKGKYATSVSGGLDSPTIASIIKNFDDSERHVLYSVVCDGAGYEKLEAPFIMDFERFINRKINYIKAPLPPKWETLEEFVRESNEPPPLLTYYISWLIAQKLKKYEVKAVFTGTAADAFLLGMEHEHLTYLASLWQNKNLLRFFIELLGLLVKRDYTTNVPKRVLSEIKDTVIKPEKDSHMKLLNPEFTQKHGNAVNSIFSETLVDIFGYMQFNDRMFASQGVEPLHPFLNNELSEYAASLPSDLKVHYGTRKYVLRQAAKGLIPESIRKSKRKFASSIPLTEWLIAWKTQILELLNSPEFRTRNYYNSTKIIEMYNKLLENQLESLEQKAFAVQLWRIISLELWLKMYIEKPREIY